MPMLARTALLPNANFGLSDWSYWSSGLIYVYAHVLGENLFFEHHILPVMDFL